VEQTYDRRKSIYCGPDHLVRPSIQSLTEHLKSISAMAEETTGLNYGSHRKIISALANAALMEVEKLLVKDIYNKETV